MLFFLLIMSTLFLNIIGRLKEGSLKLKWIHQFLFTVYHLKDNFTLVLYEDAEYLGCFNDNFFGFAQYYEKIDSDFDPNECFQKCREKNFLFAGTRKMYKINL